MTDVLKNLEKILQAETPAYFELQKETLPLEDPSPLEPPTVSPPPPSLSPSMSPEQLTSFFEACLFIAEKPLTVQQLILAAGSCEAPLALNALEALRTEYQKHSRGIELVDIAGGMQLRTKACHGVRLQQLNKVQIQSLSAGAMETLALIAYKQPVVKEAIDTVRGVDSSYYLRHLMERKLIKIAGRSELVGKPILYATTDTFLETFSLNSLADLPSLLEIQNMVPRSESNRPLDPENQLLSQQVQALGKAEHQVHFDPAADEAYLTAMQQTIAEQKLTTPHLEHLDEQLALQKEQEKLL